MYLTMSLFSGYIYLHQLLTGETEKDHNYTNEILKIMTPGLINDIHLDAIIDRLIETGLINEEDHDQMKSEEKSRGPIAATRILLQKVDKRKTNWDTEFADVLEEAGMTQIASVFKMVEHHTHSKPIRTFLFQFLFEELYIQLILCMESYC